MTNKALLWVKRFFYTAYFAKYWIGEYLLSWSSHQISTILFQLLITCTGRLMIAHHENPYKNGYRCYVGHGAVHANIQNECAPDGHTDLHTWLQKIASEVWNMNCWLTKLWNKRYTQSTKGTEYCIMSLISRYNKRIRPGVTTGNFLKDLAQFKPGDPLITGPFQDALVGS